MTEDNSRPAPLNIDVVSDVVCPWCFLGKRRLEAAVAELPDIPVAIRWRPYQLDPTVPPEGLDRDDYMTARFGDPARFQSAEDRLTELGLREGVPYHFERIRRSPNTIDAHRLVRWASAEGHQDAVVERLFNLYFAEGVDIGQHEVLAAVGEAFGLDRATTLARLAGDEDREEIRVEIAAAQQIGVTGVPTFILIGRYGVVGAQTKDVLIGAIRQAAADRDKIAATA